MRSARRARTSIPTLDGLITDRLASYPGWLPRLLAALDGHPDPESCWTWTRAKDRGYGRVKVPGSTAVAYTHRVIWLAAGNSIPAGHVLDHDGDGCGNRSCANPAHVRCVTEQVNVAVTSRSPSALHRVKTHCPKGHPLEPGNLVPSSLKRGGRECLTCRREYRRERRAKLTSGIVPRETS